MAVVVVFMNTDQSGQLARRIPGQYAGILAVDDLTPHQRMLADANALVRAAGFFPRWAHGRDHSTLRVERLTDGKKVPLRGIRFPRDLEADADLIAPAFGALREALNERNWCT